MADPTQGLPGPVVHDEVVPARAPWLHRIAAGHTLRIVDLEGNQAVDFLIYAADDDAERYSAQDTIAAQGNIFLRAGSVLLSNEGRPSYDAGLAAKLAALGAPSFACTPEKLPELMAAALKREDLGKGGAESI